MSPPKKKTLVTFGGPRIESGSLHCTLSAQRRSIDRALSLSLSQDSRWFAGCCLRLVGPCFAKGGRSYGRAGGGGGGGGGGCAGAQHRERFGAEFAQVDFCGR